jgi:hypothetical protein
MNHEINHEMLLQKQKNNKPIPLTVSFYTTLPKLLHNHKMLTEIPLMQLTQ